MVRLPLFLLAVCWLLYKLFSEKPCPHDCLYDSEKAIEDLASGVKPSEWKRRMKKGYYWTPIEEIEQREKERESQNVEVIPGVIDIKRYERDMELWGAVFVEELKKAGCYMYIIDKR